MRLLPYIASTVAGAFAWKLTRPLGVFAATLATFIVTALAFYYTRRYQRELLG
ncbi:MAG TPA: hypothetical protein VEB19_06810 [Gemmatimonadaceae bacterium]|nr:hypothetical protein [Gemmatimonadaceae bacterium]